MFSRGVPTHTTQTFEWIHLQVDVDFQVLTFKTPAEHLCCATVEEFYSTVTVPAMKQSPTGQA
jgi:hypothetical protein